MSRRHRTLWLVLGLLIALAAVLAWRAATWGTAQPAGPAAVPEPVDAQQAGAALAAAVRCPTVSREAGVVDAAAFAALHAGLAEGFPRLHATLARETVNGAALLYRWPGSDPTLPPVLLLAHQDVVPVEEGTAAAWSQPPFAGAVADGFVWGRGTLDDKGSLIAQLVAIEQLVAAGFAPRRTVLLGYGHDEEVGGELGAARIAALLAERGVRPELVLDEGMALVDGLVDGVTRPVALVGLAEKGYVSVELAVEAAGGHSSMPERPTAIGRLARAVARVEDQPMPARVAGPTRAMFHALAPEMAFGRRLVLANLWLFSPLVERMLTRDPASEAMLRTTTAATLFHAGTKENVLAAQARAVVNFRILPGDSVAGVVAHVRAVAADELVRVRALEPAQEPSPVSAEGSWGFGHVAAAARQVWPQAAVAPALVLGATDARHYAGLSPCVLRFAPLHLRPGDLERVHGRDERIAVADLADAVRFYLRLLRNAAG